MTSRAICTPGGTGGYGPWDDEQVKLAERTLKPYLARVITLGANTGQRGSDLVKMRWSDIEEYEGRPGINVTQKKTGLVIWVCRKSVQRENALAAVHYASVPVVIG
jgi:integrase